MNLSNLPLTEEDLHEIENVACQDTTWMHVTLRVLVDQIRRLQHELNDPNYLYVGSRIHRQALISRDATIAKLRKEQEQQS